MAMSRNPDGYVAPDMTLTPEEKKYVQEQIRNAKNEMLAEFHESAIEYKKQLKMDAIKKSKTGEITKKQAMEIEDKVAQFRAERSAEDKIKLAEMRADLERSILQQKQTAHYEAAKDKHSTEYEEWLLTQPSVIEDIADMFQSGIKKFKKLISGRQAAIEQSANKQKNSR